MHVLERYSTMIKEKDDVMMGTKSSEEIIQKFLRRQTTKRPAYYVRMGPKILSDLAASNSLVDKINRLSKVAVGRKCLVYDRSTAHEHVDEIHDDTDLETLIPRIKPSFAAFVRDFSRAAMFGDEETISKPSPHVTALTPYSDPVLSDDDPYDEFDPDPYGDGPDYSDDMYDDYDVNYSPPDDNDYDDDDYY